ncbi:hypothetical protein OZX72_02510 [Bifidobacterium sp. ESL0769]|uniref:hypothetical protein n=1 Tax=Bifidobacterium sp. ESL0769 TaxID=2983229 RepID=UPI0023F96EC7|nr:hypothetical protein [Bifidobacterium sp. ESL0769]WEV67880.1 hypothetical protein OZX72_02510 [Bifidobacterium sp. ESL0769]
MAKREIKSSAVAAQEAIGELTGLDASGFANQSVTMGSATVASMQDGASLCNALMSDISNVVSCVLLQANKFPRIAHVIEERDEAASQRWK